MAADVGWVGKHRLEIVMAGDSGGRPAVRLMLLAGRRVSYR
ncbi:hypothetical protein ABZ016_26920 [Streptomyces sp. NPDC006372]